MQTDPTRIVDLEDPRDFPIPIPKPSSRTPRASIPACCAGACPYDDAIKRNISFLEELLASEQLSRLQRLPQRVIDAKI